MILHKKIGHAFITSALFSILDIYLTDGCLNFFSEKTLLWYLRFVSMNQISF